MATNKRQQFRTSRESGFPPNSTNNDKTEEPFNGNGSKMGMSISELHELNRSSDRALDEQINYKESTALCDICKEYKIQALMADYLLKLRDFEIVIVCDDSGSMTTKVNNTEATRWDKLCSIVKVLIEIGVIFDSNGVDIHFLNRNKFLKVKNPKDVEQAFAKPPNGFTPLVPVLKKIFESPLARRGRDKKLLVFVATDGEPTDEDGNSMVPELKHLMEETRQPETTYVSFLVCTDETDRIDYLSEWDRTMSNVDVTDDFHTETEKIRKCQDNNFPFTYGDYIVKALVGAIIPKIDRLNERKIENNDVRVNL